MKKYLLLAMCLIAIGCKGKQGDKGEAGLQGLRGNPGPGQIIQLSGAVTSDDFTVTDSRFGLASEVSVYINSSGSLTQLPVYLPSQGFNCFYAFNATQLRIFKAQLAGASSYVIVLII